MSTPTPRVDLRPDHWAIVRHALQQHVPDREVLVFGSRATGNAKEYSDLDLVIMGEEPLSLREVSVLEEALSESDLPFKVDIVEWARIDEGFRRIIRGHGVVVQAPSEGRCGTSPEIASDWLTCTVAEACGAIDYGLTRAASNRPSGQKFLRITDIVSGQIDWNTVPYVSVGSRTAKKYRLYHGDVVLARTGASTGVSAYVKDPPPAVFASYLVRLRAMAGFDGRFLAYYLRSKGFRHYMRGVLGDKSAQPNASASTMTAAPFRAPKDPSEQRAIAQVLGTLDDKIELNRRMNETLEAMARALFKSWFVDFDPVRAKMEGRDSGLHQDIADLFPNRLVDSDMGEIPAGWKVASLGDLAKTRRWGIDPTRIATETPYIGLQHMPRRSVGLTDWGEAGTVSSRKSAFAVGDILFGKLRPYFHKVGIAPVNGVCSTDIVVLNARIPKWSAFVLACVSSSAFVAHTSQTSTGTKMPRTSWQAMSTYELCRPTDAIATGFQRVVSPMLERIVGNVHESRALAALLDTLLPRLISGELRLEEAARITGTMA